MQTTTDTLNAAYLASLKTIDWLRAALAVASPPETHCIMPLIVRAGDVQRDISLLLVAINAKE